MLRDCRTVVLCGKPTSCLNKQAHTGFSGHIMEPFLFYTKIIPHLTHQWGHLSSSASELKRNCVIKGCEKNHTGCSSDPLLLLHLIHNKPNKYAYPRSQFHYLVPLSLVKVFLYYPSFHGVRFILTILVRKWKILARFKGPWVKLGVGGCFCFTQYKCIFMCIHIYRCTCVSLPLNSHYRWDIHINM